MKRAFSEGGACRSSTSSSTIFPMTLTAVSGALRRAIECGAVVAWFGFEGSFDFDHLLTEGISAQVYAFAGSSEVAVSTDEVLATEELGPSV